MRFDISRVFKQRLWLSFGETLNIVHGGQRRDVPVRGAVWFWTAELFVRQAVERLQHRRERSWCLGRVRKIAIPRCALIASLHRLFPWQVVSDSGFLHQLFERKG